MTSTRASRPSSPPCCSARSAKIFFFSRLRTRSCAPAEPLRRTSTEGLVSGSSVSIFQSSCSPMKPVTPVITIFLPASRSRRRP